MGEVERLNTLAEQINAEHRAFVGTLRKTAEHGIRAGELLAEAKAQCPHGTWLPWLELNFEGSTRTAQEYMRLYNHRDEIRAKTRDSAHLSISGALGEIASPRRDASITGALGEIAASPDSTVNITQEHGDEVAAETAERVANGEFKSTFDAYEEIKSEGEGDQKEEGPRSMAEVHDELMKARRGGEEGPPSITRIKRAGEMNYVVEWSDGGSNTVLRKKVLEHGYNKCEHCSGLGVKRKGGK